MMAVTASVSALTAAAAGAATGSITGMTFQDLNRDGTFSTGDVALSNQQIYLLSADGTTYIASAVSDTNGAYRFDGVSDGDYDVEYASPSWSSLRDGWTPTTTPTIWPKQLVHVAGTGTANFGWRPITRSTDVNAPIARFVAPSGLVVNSYDDVVAPADVYSILARGGLVGAEAAKEAIRFDWGSSSTTTIGVGQDAGGRYMNYAAVTNITWASWLDRGEQTLFHEYGHAWSLYYAYIAQQDPSFAGYLGARGLTGNPNLNSSYVWNVREIVAEDYRQLFATPAGAVPAQMNPYIPPAAQVNGLRDYLATTFEQPVAQPAPPPPPPAVAISGITISPVPVAKSATVSVTITQPAQLTIVIVNSKGVTVRTLLANSSRTAGTTSVPWDRKDASGRRVASGTYTLRADAVDAAGNRAAASTNFAVS
jgi:hypothetical protein